MKNLTNIFWKELKKLKQNKVAKKFLKEYNEYASIALYQISNIVSYRFMYFQLKVSSQTQKDENELFALTKS